MFFTCFLIEGNVGPMRLPPHLGSHSLMFLNTNVDSSLYLCEPIAASISDDSNT
jgi:hypothetical protein